MRLNFSICDLSNFASVLSFSHILCKTICYGTTIFTHKANLYYLIFTFQLLSCQVMIFKLKVKIVNWISCWLIILQMKILKIWMSKSISNTNSSVRIESQKFFQKIDSFRMGKGKYFIEVLSYFLVLRKVFNQSFTFFRNMFHIINIRSS